MTMNEFLINDTPVKIWAKVLDPIAYRQIYNLAALPFVFHHLAFMPDVHAGVGMPIGGVLATKGVVVPNAVGVDIGCGMCAVKTNVRVEDITAEVLRKGIMRGVRKRIPLGMDRHKTAQDESLMPQGFDIDSMTIVKNQYKSALKQIGTLGGGNHFIELDKDDDENVYLVIHTGSRNLGKQVAEIYQAKAVKHLTAGADEFEETIKRTIEEYKAAGRRSELQDVIKKMRKEYKAAEPSLPADLCYIEGEAREHYLHDMRICQRWAVLNRKLISLLLTRFFLDVAVLEEFESVHNYISDENIIRKGSISAAEGERCIIPLNMRDGSLLCTGKGNPDWNYSAPHGAGRVLSRTQAYEKITMEDFEASMQGIYSESVNDFTRDESPMVYKPASEIIANIGDTVTIDTIIRPIFNFKAS